MAFEKRFTSILFPFILISFVWMNKIKAQSFLLSGEDYYKRGYKVVSIDFDSSEYYFNKAIPLLREEKKWQYYIDCHNGLGLIYFSKGDFKLATDFILKADKLSQKHLKPDDPYYGAVINNVGIILKHKGNFLKALDYYQKSLKINLQNDSLKNQLSSNYQNIGALYELKKDYSQALNFFKKSIEMAFQVEDKFTSEMASLFLFLGKCHFEKGDFEKALKEYFQAEKLYLSQEDNDTANRNLVSTYYLISKTYLEIDQINKAKYFLTKSQEYNIFKVEEYKYFEISGNILDKQNKNAIPKYKQAIELIQEEYSHQEISFPTARQYQNLADAQMKLGEVEEALLNYQIGLTKLTFDYEEAQNFYSNPKDVKKMLPVDESFVILENKGIAFHQYYKKTQNLRDLQAALETFKLAAKLVSRMRQEIITTGSKQQLAGEALSIYENGIKVALELYELTKDQRYLEDAFKFSESNKAILLLESLQEELARNYGGIPDSLKERERDLRIDITFYEKQINQENTKGEEADQEKIKKWEENLFDFNSKYQELVKILEKDYPKYYQLKYNTQLATIAELQSKLDNKSALIEYFVGEKDIHQFVISKNQIKIFTIPKWLEFENDVNLLLGSLKERTQIRNNYFHFTQKGYELYEKLLSEALKVVPARINRLILIPDDMIGYIPFETFLRQPYEAEEVTFKPSKLAYLFEDYTLSYSYSSTLLLNNWNTPKREYNDNFLGFAPAFEKPMADAVRNCSQNELYSLKCSAHEIQKIQTLLGGQIVLDSAANRSNFEKLSTGYRIVHLATHACADDANPQFSKIYFSDQDLSNSDLSTLDIPAELAVLSACNTGAGKLIKGEGLMSLAKGFINAGCPSTLQSLWSVDDCTTSEIMLLFYKKLLTGLDKDEALQQAKLEYLKTSDSPHQHPYYWAAFVQMGNFQPIRLKAFNFNTWIIGIAMAIGLFFFGRRYFAI